MTVTVTVGSKTYDFQCGKEKKDKFNPMPCNSHENTTRAVRITEPDQNKTKTRKPERTQLKKLQRRPSMIQMIRKSIEEGEEDICYLDKYSRIVFPVSYIIFLGIYFGIYTVRWESLVDGVQTQ